MPTGPSPENQALAKKISPELIQAGNVERFVRSTDRPKTPDAIRAKEIAKQAAEEPERTLNTNQFRK